MGFDKGESMDLEGARVIVTGANGFIGRRLVDGLIRANAKVTVLLRSSHGKAFFDAQHVRVAICQLAKGDTLTHALKGQEILFHFAYDVRASSDDNLAAFTAVVGSAKSCGVKRIVHASSAVVYDNWPGGSISESSQISRSGTGGYRNTKVAMENTLIAGDIPTAILQPTIVYGPGSPLWTIAPQAMLRKGPVVLPDPPGTCPAVYVDDVVQAAIMAAKLPDLKQERFLISGPDIPTWAEFFQAHAKLIGAGEIELRPATDLRAQIPSATDPVPETGPSPMARLSKALRSVIGGRRFEQLKLKLSSLLPSGGPQLPNLHQLELFLVSPDISTVYACERLGYEPQFDLKAGMAAIAAALDADRQ